MRGWLWLFVNEEVYVGDDAAREGAFKLARGPFGSFVNLYERILKGGIEGRYGCWSY